MSEEAAVPTATVPPTVEDAAPPAPEPDAGTQTEDKEPVAVFHSQSKLNERLGRHYKSQIKKDFGVESAAEIQERLQAYDALKSAEEERQREAMSEQERLNSDLTAAQEQLQARSQELENLRFETETTKVCSKLGITDVEYAMFQLAKAADASEDDAQLDIEEVLSGLASDPNMARSLGVAGEAAPVPANTAPTGVQNDVPPAPNPGNQTVDAMKMSKEEYRALLRQHGI